MSSTNKKKKSIKFQLLTIHSAVEFEIEEEDYHNLFVGSNKDPYLQIKVVSPDVVQLIVNPAKFPNFKGE
jgi:hypothetical protein